MQIVAGLCACPPRWSTLLAALESGLGKLECPAGVISKHLGRLGGFSVRKETEALLFPQHTNELARGLLPHDALHHHCGSRPPLQRSRGLLPAMLQPQKLPLRRRHVPQAFPVDLSRSLPHRLPIRVFSYVVLPLRLALLSIWTQI
eukprot:scaffold2277_cov256-Pinguiococcus_pyrenoidosus.AAC.21